MCQKGTFAIDLGNAMTLGICVMMWQEEEEADYRRAFPDHTAAFADILADAEEDGDWAGPAQADGSGVMEQQASQAEAGSAAAQALLQGDILEDIVAQHAR